MGKTAVWSYDCSDGLREEGLTLLDLDAWRVTLVQPVSPAHLYLLAHRRTLTKLPDHPSIQVATEDVGVLHAAALGGFRSLTRQQLIKLDQDEVEAGVDTSMKLGDILFKMISKVLDSSVDDVLRILARRCAHISSDERDALLKSDAAQDLYHDVPDMKDAAQCVEADEKVEADMAEVVETIKEKPSHGKPAEPAAKEKKEAKTKFPQEAEFDLKHLRLCAPVNAKLWYDCQNKRYQIFYEGCSCSRSCGRYGEAEAARLVLQWAWTCEALFTGRDCPIEGIFK